MFIKYKNNMGHIIFICNNMGHIIIFLSAISNIILFVITWVMTYTHGHIRKCRVFQDFREKKNYD